MRRASTSASGADPLICRSPAFERVLQEARRAARSDLTVLLTGETGSGKGRIAREIHDHSARREQAIVIWSACEVSESLAYSQLFGHKKGAFTGADRDSVGIIESANGGTLVIDDVDKLSPPLQGQLLRFLDQRSVRPAGSNALQGVNLRLIVTTSRVLSELVEQGRFLPDLMWRLSGLRIHVPPLRERREDIAALIIHFAAHFAESLRVPAPRFSKGALAALFDQPWRGNVRELAAAVENLVFRASARGEIQARDVIRESGPVVEAPAGNGERRRASPGPRDPRLAPETVARAMARTKGNGARAAALLGVPIRTLRRWLARYGLSNGHAVAAGSNGNGNGAAKAMGNGHG